MDESKQKIALFIDADNAPANKFDDILSEVAKYGVVTIRKAYGNWKSPTLKSWEEICCMNRPFNPSSNMI